MTTTRVSPSPGEPLAEWVARLPALFPALHRGEWRALWLGHAPKIPPDPGHVAETLAFLSRRMMRRCGAYGSPLSDDMAGWDACLRLMDALVREGFLDRHHREVVRVFGRPPTT
jgi:hypothetical protein